MAASFTPEQLAQLAELFQSMAAPTAKTPAKAFPLAKVHPCTAKTPCKRLSRTAIGAATHLAANSPRNAKGHTPVR